MYEFTEEQSSQIDKLKNDYLKLSDIKNNLRESLSILKSDNDLIYNFRLTKTTIFPEIGSDERIEERAKRNEFLEVFKKYCDIDHIFDFLSSNQSRHEHIIYYHLNDKIRDLKKEIQKITDQLIMIKREIQSIVDSVIYDDTKN